MESYGAGELSAHLVNYTLNSHPIFLPTFLPPFLIIVHSPTSICPHYPKGGCGFYVCSSYHSQLAFTRCITLQRPQLSSHVWSWVSALASFLLKGHPMRTLMAPVTQQVNGNSRQEVQIQIRIRIQIIHSTTAGFTSLTPTSFTPPRFWV